LLHTFIDFPYNYNLDKFRLEIFDGDTDRVLNAHETFVSPTSSPWYWESPIMSAQSTDGVYRIEMWDINSDGAHVSLVDRAYHQCHTGASWRSDKPLMDKPHPDLPTNVNLSCIVEVPFYTSDLTPKPGWLHIVWSQGHLRTDSQFHVMTYRMEKGQGLDNVKALVPCGVYVKVYFRADGEYTVRFMPSQYGDLDYGTNGTDQVHPSYHTRFPFTETISRSGAVPALVTPTSTPKPGSTISPQGASATPKPPVTGVIPKPSVLIGDRF
jgi:hypothetical protein